MTENAEIMTTPSVTLSRHRVVALAYDGLCTFEFGVAVEIFGLPRPDMGERWYRFAVAAVDEGELRATGGIRLMTDGGMSLLSEADTIVVPGWRSIDSSVPPDLCQALVAAHARGCRIISICSGVFVLAAAGLLNGRQATTHWRYTDQLRARFPLIEVIDDVLYVGAEGVMTSAGSAAGIDLCLHLVRKDFGIDAANIVARRLVVSPSRRRTGAADCSAGSQSARKPATRTIIRFSAPESRRQPYRGIAGGKSRYGLTDLFTPF